MLRMTGNAFIQTTLTNGSAKQFSMQGAPLPATVWAVVASGDTITIEISFDGGTTWQAWSKGVITASDYDTLNSGCTDIRFTRSAGSGTTSKCGVC